MPTTKIPTPEELQVQAVRYFHNLKLPDGVTLEVWAPTFHSGERCGAQCRRVGFVHIADLIYCVEHATVLIMGLSGTRHVEIDVDRPIVVPDELAASGDLLELVRNFLYFIADSKDRKIGEFICSRATTLGNLCDTALLECETALKAHTQ